MDRIAFLMKRGWNAFSKVRQLLRIFSVACGSSFLFGRNSLSISAQRAAKPTKSPSVAGAADRQRLADETEMEKVMEIGGLFFRAPDPKGLAKWYQQHLGITLAPTSYEAPVWEQVAGPTIFDPFAESSNYFGDPAKVWMVNFRVRDLDKMAAQLGASGIAVKIDPQSYPNGRFARRYDPRHGYRGPMPARGDQQFNHFHANEARDGQGHVGNAGHNGGSEHSLPGYQGGGHGGGHPSGGSSGGGHPSGGGAHH